MEERRKDLESLDRGRVWDRLDALGAQNGVILAELAAIRAMLCERCEARGKEIGYHEKLIAEIDARTSKAVKRIEHLEKEKIKLVAWAGGTGFTAAAVGWALTLIFGGHK